MGEQSIRVPDQEKVFASISGQASTAATALGKFMELTSLAKSYHDLENARKVLRTHSQICLLYTSPSPRDQRGSRMPSSA